MQISNSVKRRTPELEPPGGLAGEEASLALSTRKKENAPALNGVEGPRKRKHKFSKRKPMSEETKNKIALAKQGKALPPETKRKISESMLGREMSLAHRFNISQSKRGTPLLEDTRKKIGAGVSAAKRKSRTERLAAIAAAAAEEATADLRPVLMKIAVKDEEEVVVDTLALEKLVIELTTLRRQLSMWMDSYEKKFGRKADLTEASENHPLVYARFVRYVALRELVRRSSTAVGETPVTWN